MTYMESDYIRLGVLVVALLSNCFVSLIIFAKKLQTGSFSLRLQETRVSPINVPWWTGALLLASIFLTVWLQSMVFNIVFALIPVTTLTLCRIAPFPYWDLKIRDFFSYLLIALWTLFIVLIPFYLIMLGSVLLFKSLGFHSLQTPIQLLLQIKNIPLLIKFIILAVIVAPILEEMGFRGFLYPLLKKYFGRWGATFLVSALFALVHMHAPTFIPLFCLSVIFVVLYEITGSLGYSIALHMLFNATSCILTLAAKPFMQL